jgi:hypothetical protein
MSQRRLLFLFCLALGFLSLVQLTHADGDLHVNESRTRFLLHTDSIEVQLAVENTTGETRNGSVRLELLDKKDTVLSETFETQPVAPGNQTLRFKMPPVTANLTKFERRELLWYRLRYRFVDVVRSSMSIKSGIISLSEIMPDLFEIRVATSEILREGGRYRARVLATHPFTKKPTAGVQIKGEITFADYDDVKASASATTTKEGYALLDFSLPASLAKSSSGDLRVVGTRDGVVAEAEGEVMVDSLARTLITSDKTLYQPGQTMHVRALVFGATKRALVNQNITIKIVDPEGLNVFVANGRTSRFGVVNTDWQVPDNVRLGTYRIWVDREGTERQAALDVRISRYELPNFTVSVEPDRGYYLPGQNAKVKVRADYLFGQPVRRGLVRVVEESGREWNFREQQWSIDEGDEYEGETDAQGTFEATVDLASEHEDIADSDYNPFKDLTYTAYFTDPTTNRTEQRRFTLRVTREAIHVYLITSNYDSYQSDLPLQFYVSTFYADGSPARCKVDVLLTNNDKTSSQEKETTRPLQRTFRTNRYGLAKTSIRIGSDLADRHSINLKVLAADPNGRTGSTKQRFYSNDDPIVFVDTEKALYNAGEPIVATITSNLPDQTLVVELAKDMSVVRSERVRLRGGKATVTFPYTPNLTGRVTVAAYPDFADASRLVGLRTVLYPGNPELNLNVRTSQATYRPGDDASVSLRVRTSEGHAAESALGVVVSDKAVDERMRTDSEFGGRYQPYNETVNDFLGLSEELSGVTFRDLRRLDLAKGVPADLDLLAEILFNQYRPYYPGFYRDEEYETDLAKVFGPLINPQVKPVYDALYTRYLRNAEFPTNESTLRQFLRDAHVDLQQIFDPWGTNYSAKFFIEGRVDVFTLTSAGADKRFDTADDFSVLRMNWDYFIPTGNKIQSAVDRYHVRNKGFIRDLETLHQELARNGFALDQLRDRWGKPYRFDFLVNETNYVIEVSSGGPDRRFSDDPDDSEDDFKIWTAQIDYFADPRRLIEKTLSEKLESTKTFPASELELREALRNSPYPFETLRDPWNRSYYPSFKTESVYADRVEVENRASLGNPGTTQTRLLPVTKTIASITLKSPGQDGRDNTADDFAVATFSRVIREETRGATPLQPVDLVLSSTNGAIYGVVTDVNGAVIPKVRIMATRTPDIHRYYTETDENGAYVLKDLPPGLYEVLFESTGFVKSVIEHVQIRVSSLTQIDVVMEAGAVTETVTVTGGAAPAINTSEVSQSIQPRSVLSLPGLAKSTDTLAQISTPRLREFFPETLVWQPSIETDQRGNANIKFKLADNITTWKMAVIGSTEDGRIGTAETEFKAFQPFFVEHDPPRILTEGDEISLPVVVRNYLDRLQKVDLEIKPENWFSLIGPARKQTSVAAGDATRETFDFRIVSSGENRPQRITALGSNANDAIEKPVTVHPDGEELSLTAGDILSSSAALEVNVPENAIPNSTRAELKIYPNLMAHVVESVEKIMARPYGCGEQTISSTYPSLLLLRNSKQTGEDSALRTQAQRYLNIGYTRLLSYRDESGGVAYWNDGSPDVALTTYALRFLADASDVIEVDRQVIRQAREWLMKQQDSDGSWGPHQFAVTDQTQIRQRALLTAYVARVLAATEAKLFLEGMAGVTEQERAAFAASLNRAVAYVSQKSSEIDEPYLLASYALALLELRDAARAKTVIEKLRSLARNEGTGSYWSLEANTPFYGWGLAGRIETTALVVQALSRYCGMQEGNCADDSELIKRGLLFLFKNKDGYGVWYSTQATINVLDTMLTIFTSNRAGRVSDAVSTAQIEVNGRPVQTVTIPETRRLSNPITVPITSFLSTGKNRIEVKRPEGGSYSSVQVMANYYAPWMDKLPYGNSTELRFSTTFDKTEGKIGDSITCHVEAERVGFRGYGMLLAEVGLPPGADVDRSSLEKARKDWTIMQYDVLPDRIVLYLWPRAGGVKFDFQFRPRFGIGAKTAPSVIYDYYNPEARLLVQPVKFRIK